MGIRVRLDSEALLELRLQECVEGFLPSPSGIDRSSDYAFPGRRDAE